MRRFRNMRCVSWECNYYNTVFLEKLKQHQVEGDMCTRIQKCFESEHKWKVSFKDVFPSEKIWESTPVIGRWNEQHSKKTSLSVCVTSRALRKCACIPGYTITGLYGLPVAVNSAMNVTWSMLSFVCTPVVIICFDFKAKGFATHIITTGVKTKDKIDHLTFMAEVTAIGKPYKHPFGILLRAIFENEILDFFNLNIHLQSRTLILRSKPLILPKWVWIPCFVTSVTCLGSNHFIGFNAKSSCLTGKPDTHLYDGLLPIIFIMACLETCNSFIVC